MNRSIIVLTIINLNYLCLSTTRPLGCSTTPLLDCSTARLRAYLTTRLVKYPPREVQPHWSESLKGDSLGTEPSYLDREHDGCYVPGLCVACLYVVQYVVCCMLYLAKGPLLGLRCPFQCSHGGANQVQTAYSKPSKSLLLWDDGKMLQWKVPFVPVSLVLVPSVLFHLGSPISNLESPASILLLLLTSEF